MLTEVDIVRIMAAKRQLTESIVDDADFKLINIDEIFEPPEEDTSASEITDLM